MIFSVLERGRADKDSASLYYATPAAQQFALKIIGAMEPLGQFSYPMSAWPPFKRLIELMVREADPLIVGELKRILGRMGAFELRPKDSESPFVEADNIGFLKIRVEHMSAALRKAKPPVIEATLAK